MRIYCKFTYIIQLGIFSLTHFVCNAITNPNFNAQIREFAMKEDNDATTTIKTLQKEGLEQYTNFVPILNPTRFKNVPDNEVSSSSYSRGLLQNREYASHDYEDGLHEGYPYEYHYVDNNNHGHPHFNHYPSHFPSGYQGSHYPISHHHKHYDYALAAKSILWPIAGVALLGAAAALVSNPVLLQLGVVSGKRKRRYTDEITSPDFDINADKWSKISEEEKDTHNSIFSGKKLTDLKRRIFENLLVRKQTNVKNVRPTAATVERVSLEKPIRYNKYVEDKQFIPIPLKKHTKEHQLLSL